MNNLSNGNTIIDSYPEGVFRFCPKCGSEGFQYQSDSSFKCNSCSFRYFINSSTAVTAIIRAANGKILLTERLNDPMKGTLDLPGGFVDVGESAEEALAREIKEELNLTVTDYSYFGSYPNRYLYGGIVYFTLDMVFICNVEGFKMISAGDDVADYMFLDIKEIDMEAVGLESVKKVLADYTALNS